MASGAAKRYAQAVFSLAKERGALDRWLDDLAALNDLMSDPQAAEFLASPAVPEARKFEVMRSQVPPPPHAEAMTAISDFANRHDPGAQVVAPLLRGFTDCHFFREKGIPCLGFMPQRSTPASEGLVHGIDERVSLESLKFGIRAIYEIVKNLAAR